MSIFFEVQNLSLRLGKNPIIEDISFALNQGETLAIIGPNGAGKTMLLKILLGALPHQGKVIWHQKPIFGYVPQRFEINRTTPLSVKELFYLHQKNSNFWLPKKDFKNDIIHNLEHVNAENLFQRQVGSLSRGQLQRVLIAYALVGNPNIIFFDEPTASIDAEGEVVIHKLLKHLTKELGITLVVVTHDLNIAYKFADKVLCLNKKMFCFGPVSEVLTPHHLGAVFGTGEKFIHFHHHE